MKILIDIGHPAHVHYFRNLIKILTSKGHSILVTARNKEVTHNLLKAYSIRYIDRGTGYDSILGKIYYTIKGDHIIYRNSIKFKPNLFLSFGSPYAAHVAKIMNKPHIAMDDTEHARFTILSYAPLTKAILTPESFTKSFGAKQIKFRGFMELCYLHPKYYQPDITIIHQMKIEPSEKYIIIRFVSWKAGHDKGVSGFSLKDKISLVTELAKKYKVFVSSEGELDDTLRAFKLNIPPEKIHDLLFHSSLYIGEGATMASEAAVLGVPSIYINPLTAGTLKEQERKYGLLFQIENKIDAINKANEILGLKDRKNVFQQKRLCLLRDNIDVTAFFAWFVENYPMSRDILLKEPEFQYTFR